MDEQFAKEVEKALDIELHNLDKPKANGPVKPGKVTLAVEIDQVIDGLQTRIRQLETIRTAVEALRNTL